MVIFEDASSRETDALCSDYPQGERSRTVTCLDYGHALMKLNTGFERGAAHELHY